MGTKLEFVKKGDNVFKRLLTSLLKTVWEKEKLLVMSNFSFSHSVFYPPGELSAIFVKFETVICRLFQFERVPNFLFGKGLNPLFRTVDSLICYYFHPYHLFQRQISGYLKFIVVNLLSIC